MGITNRERELVAKLKEIQEQSPKVELDLNNVNEYFATLEQRVGTVENYQMAGYILPNGKLTDASLNNFFENNDSIMTHCDVRFFGFSDYEIMQAGALRLGYCFYNEIPYVEISLQHLFPSAKQFEVLDDILLHNPKQLDVEAKMTDDIEDKVSRAFYKRYVLDAGDSSKTIKQDLRSYLNGDKTYCGCYDEFTGEVTRPEE